MAGLIDQWGNPLEPSVLTTPVATPTVVGMRPAVTPTALLPGLDPARLGMLMRDADQGTSWAWMMLASEIERRDLHTLGVLNTRKRVISQLPITVEAASPDPEHEKHAAFIRAWLKTGVLKRRLYDMLDAISKGYSVLEIEWILEPGNNRPGNLLFRPQKWFEVDYRDGETILMRSQDLPPATSPIDGAPPVAGLANIPPERFLIHRHPSWSGLTIEAGMMRAVAWAVMFKMFTMRDWAVFVQNYGLPMRVGRYGPGSSIEDREVLWRAVTDIAGGMAAIIPQGMAIEFPEPKSSIGGADLHERRLRYLDEQISKAVLGQTGTTDSKQGAHASSQTHRLVQEDIERSDAGLVADTANEQLIARMIAFTFGEQPGGYPVISIGRPDEAPTKDVIDAIQWAGPQGFKVRADDLRERLNLKPPQPDDEIVGGVLAPPPPVQPPHDLPATVRPPRQVPGRAAGATIRTPPADDSAVHLHTRLGRVLERHARSAGPNVIQLMTARTAQEASAAMDGMMDTVRDAMMHATDMDDLQRRLEGLHLSPDAFADAMAQAMIVAELVGESEILDQVRDGKAH